MWAAVKFLGKLCRIFGLYFKSESKQGKIGEAVTTADSYKEVPEPYLHCGFVSPCTVHQDARNKSLDERGKQGLTIGRSDKIKGYMAFIPKEKIVIVTWHVRYVETLTKEQNAQLRRVLLVKNDVSVE